MKISVGVCTHNGEDYIAEQLNSILGQTVLPDEIILTDDNSSDNTVNIAKQILKKSGVKYTVTPFDSHQGILKNFQSCIDLCTGDIIFSCDQDDIWMPDKIESFLPYFEQGCNFVYSNAIVVDKDRNMISDDFWDLYGIDFEKLEVEKFKKMALCGLFIAGCNMAFTKELYDKIKPIPYHFLHDGWVAICAPLFGKMSFINKPLIEYRRHGKNTSQFSSDKKDGVKKNYTNNIKVKKKWISDIYRKTLPDQWFGNHHYYICNKIFYDKMNLYMSTEYSNLVLNSIKFYESLLKCLPSHRIKSMCILIKEFIVGRYKSFRGNWKRFVKDIIFILFNENKSFQHDFDKW